MSDAAGGRGALASEGKQLYPGCTLPPVNRMTHACEDIIFPASLVYAVCNKTYTMANIYNCGRNVKSVTFVKTAKNSIVILFVHCVTK